MSKYKYNINNLDCANCAAELERAIQKIEGVDEENISFMTEKMIIECKDENKDEVMEIVAKKIVFPCLAVVAVALKAVLPHTLDVLIRDYIEEAGLPLYRPPLVLVA